MFSALNTLMTITTNRVNDCKTCCSQIQILKALCRQKGLSDEGLTVDVLEFKLCAAFGWEPTQLKKQVWLLSQTRKGCNCGARTMSHEQILLPKQYEANNVLSLESDGQIHKLPGTKIAAFLPLSRGSEMSSVDFDFVSSDRTYDFV
jgi:hypothetical protein